MTEAAVEEDDAEIHPVYGKLLIDLGYKKTYVTSVRQLLLAKVSYEKDCSLMLIQTLPWSSALPFVFTSNNYFLTIALLVVHFLR